MKFVVDFFRQNYTFVIDAVVCIFAFIIGLRGERKGKKSAAMAEILAQLPEMVSQVESVFPVGNGNVKLGFVLRWVEKLCAAKSIKFDKSFFAEAVESILSAPTSVKLFKGGDQCEEKKDN